MSGFVRREPTTPMRNAFLLSTTVFIAFATAGYCQNGSARAVVTNRVPMRAISLFFGPPANDEAGRKMREITGGNPYNPGQAQSIEEVRKRAIDAIKQEGRPIDEDYECAANIEMTTGKCTLLLNKTGAPHYSVNFDSSGKITYVGGASGPHGEGGWGREYTRGQRSGAARTGQTVDQSLEIGQEGDPGFLLMEWGGRALENRTRPNTPSVGAGLTRRTPG
jgi:hypothetical protein